MQEILTPKNGEGASVSRRKFMAFAAAGSAATLPAVALAEAGGKTSRLPQHTSEYDPLISAIRRYRSGCEAYGNLVFDEGSDEQHDLAISSTYGPPMQVLEDWDKRPTTKEGAAAALRLAEEENEVYSRSAVSLAMVRATLMWLEGGEA